MLVLHVPLDALRAKLALIEREVLPGLEPDDLLVLDLELDPALLTTEAAVRLDQAIGLANGRPPAGGLAIGMRPEFRNELFDRRRKPRHHEPPRAARQRSSWASASVLRRQGGQTSW